MNKEEAKLILQCRRPRGQDDKDPAIQEALTLVNEDSDTMDLVRREERLDAAICDRLKCLCPPPDLLGKILVCARVSSRPRPRWRTPSRLLAVAAMVTAGVFVAVKYLPPASTPGQPVFATAFPEFRVANIQKLKNGPKLEKLSSIDKVKARLAERSAGKEPPVPTHLCECTVGTVGCEVFEWHGNEVTLICFKTGANGVVHLFTVDASVLSALPRQSECIPIQGWQTLAWIENGKLMMLAGEEEKATGDDLRSFVEQ